MWMMVNIAQWQQYHLIHQLTRNFFGHLVFSDSLLVLPEIIFYWTPHWLQPRSDAMCRRRSHQNYRANKLLRQLRASQTLCGVVGGFQASYEFSNVESFLLRALQFHFCTDSIPPCRAMLLPPEGGFVDCMTPFCTWTLLERPSSLSTLKCFSWFQNKLNQNSQFEEQWHRRKIVWDNRH